VTEVGWRSSGGSLIPPPGRFGISPDDGGDARLPGRIAWVALANGGTTADLGGKHPFAPPAAMAPSRAEAA
jgi:hypothetical protein